MLKLNMTLTNPRLSTDQKLEAVCSLTNDMIEGADRVSLWLFDEEKSQIESIMCLDSTQGKFTKGAILKQRDFTNYFDAILNQDVVNAPNAHTHESTSCFTESYFKPNNIISLLDFILHRDFKPAGIICCESVGRQVSWDESDIANLKKIAMACSMYFNIEE